MEPPGCVSETLGGAPQPQQTKSDRECDLWVAFEGKLSAWAELEWARLRKKSPLSQQSQLLVSALAPRLARRLVQIFQRAAHALPDADRCEVLAAISRLFLLTEPSDRGRD
jgi:hypothetical protein